MQWQEVANRQAALALAPNALGLMREHLALASNAPGLMREHVALASNAPGLMREHIAVPAIWSLGQVILGELC